MNITQTFYNDLAPHYDKLFLDWQATTFEQAKILNTIFNKNGFDHTAHILDCACGIGTQAIGLARLGYHVTASDISGNAIVEAQKRAIENNVTIRFENADFCALSNTFSEQFDIILAMDNALPHMLSDDDLGKAVKSIGNQMKNNGIFVGSIRDYDSILKEKPPYSPPYIHKYENGQRICFQTWDWEENTYKLVQYIIDDNNRANPMVSKFECEYRSTRREELTNLFLSNGCSDVSWLFPEESGFYQPIIIARK